MNPTTVIWLVAGAALCLLELVLPTGFIEFVLGVSALIVAIVSLILPQFSLQVLLWMILSLGLTLVTRRFARRQLPKVSLDSSEGETLTEILPGKTGRVLHEGNSWQAICEDEQMGIPPHTKVYIVGRRGTTLIVVPENLLYPGSNS